MRSEPVLLQAVTCKQFYGWESLWKLYICKITWGTSHFEVCVDKVIRHNATKKSSCQKEERVFAGVLASISMLKQQQDWELNWEGGRQWCRLESSPAGMCPYIPKPWDEEKKPTHTHTLRKLQVMICLPRSVLAFFIACLLLGRGRVYQVQIQDIKQIYPCYF